AIHDQSYGPGRSARRGSTASAVTSTAAVVRWEAARLAVGFDQREGMARVSHGAMHQPPNAPDFDRIRLVFRQQLAGDFFRFVVGLRFADAARYERTIHS